MRDVIVIGAGPAGSMAAGRLASLGHDVLVLEEHRAIGAPVHCTGLLGAEAFDEFDLPRSLILGAAGRVRFWGAAGLSVPVQSGRVSATVIDRSALDAWLAREAARAGAEIRSESRAERVEIADRQARVMLAAGGPPLEARAVVLACGANYRFHRRLGLGMPDLFLQSAQVETAFAALPEIDVQFGRDVAPGGFAWAVPFKRADQSFVRIGLMSETRSRERFRAFVHALGARVGVNTAVVAEPRLKMLPLAPVSKTYGPRVLAVGDAAGLVKPTTGGGIFYGLISGALAAETLAEGLRRNRLDDRALSRYETRWRRRLGQEIRVGMAFRRIAARLDDQSIDELVELARVDGIVPLLHQTAAFNWHRKAAVALLMHPAFRRIVFRSFARTPAH